MKTPDSKKKVVNYVTIPTKTVPKTPWDNLFDPKGYKSKEALELEEANKAAEAAIAKHKAEYLKNNKITGNKHITVKGGAPLKDVFEQKGSTTKTIYTSNPSDPRIKSTKDSLDLYNKHQGGRLVSNNFDPLKSSYEIQDPKVIEKEANLYGRGSAEYGLNEIINKKYPKIKPIATVGIADGWNEYAFKKPSTSVIYKKDTQSTLDVKKPLKVSNLSVEGSKTKTSYIKDTSNVVTMPRYTQVQKGKWMRPVELNRIKKNN